MVNKDFQYAIRCMYIRPHFENKNVSNWRHIQKHSVTMYVQHTNSIHCTGMLWCSSTLCSKKTIPFLFLQ